MNAEPGWLMKERKEALILMPALPLPPFRKGLTIALDTRDFPDSNRGINPRGSFASGSFLLPREASGDVFFRNNLFSLLGPEDRLLAAHIAQARVECITLKRGDGTPLTVTCDDPVHLLIHAEAGVQKTVIILGKEQPSQRKQGFITRGIELFLEKNACILLVHLNGRKDAHTLTTVRSKLAEGSVLTMADLVIGGKTTLLRTRIDLAGKKSSSLHTILLLPEEGEQVDCEAATIHAVPETASRLDVRGAIDTYGKGIVQGTIHIKQAARESSAFQDLEILLVGEGAEGDAIPILAIDNPDVCCSHAARVGTIDPALLYYMTSRGISEGKARALLIEGFFRAKLSTLPPAAQAAFQEKINGITARPSP